MISASSLLAIPALRRLRRHGRANAADVSVGAVAAETRGALSPDAPLKEYFRYPDDAVTIGTAADPSACEGYFSFDGLVAYGRCSGGSPSRGINGTQPSISAAVQWQHGRVDLPFDIADVVTNLRQERYTQASQSWLGRVTSADGVRSAYYFVRPILPVAARKHLQRIRLRGWERIPFPKWPVDFTVESVMDRTLTLAMRSRGIEKLPFIWFWPDGAECALMMTHDIETGAGREFCETLMDLDDSFGVKAAFQVVPETHCERTTGLLSRLRSRGFEANLHDYNHDGELFRNRDLFLKRAAEINRHARELGCRGFRSGAMYREQSWFDAFEFAYDMSVPNVAHLEPQRGGCCTAMPYFVGDVLELPLTTTQDYSLFHILGDYSIDLWKQQVEAISSRNGLVSFIVHPDYVIERRARGVYTELLTHLRRMREERNVWVTLPGEVDRWWRSRRQMSLIPEGDSWRIEGPDSERARLAYARLDGDRLVYEVDERRSENQLCDVKWQSTN